MQGSRDKRVGQLSRVISPDKKRYQLKKEIMEKEKNIYKKRKHIKNFSIIDNKIFKSGLSLGAIGVLTALLSKPEDWVISKQYFIDNHSITRWNIDKIFKELEDAGFLTKEQGKKTKENQSGISYKVYEETILVDLTK